MSDVIDPRLADRRRRVAEDRARGNLSRLLWILVVLAVGAAVVWVLQSPFLSVSEIVVRGAVETDPRAILAEHDVVEGRPMILVDTDGPQEDLSADPWIHDVTVAREWPTTVAVSIDERAPAAVVRFSDGDHLVAADGVVLEPAVSAGSLPVAYLPHLSAADGDDDLETAGAVGFLAALPPDRRHTAEVSSGPDGLVATVSGYEIRLGRPFDMEDKAVVTSELLEAGVEEGSIITVVAPASPAVLAPGADTQAETGSEDAAEGDGDGAQPGDGEDQANP